MLYNGPLVWEPVRLDLLVDWNGPPRTGLGTEHAVKQVC